MASAAAAGAGAFAAAKARAMDLLAPDLDRSHAGGIDAPILSLCELINARPEFYTTSSCSGRVVLFWQRELAAAGAVGPDAELEPEPEPVLADGDAEPPLDERTKAAGGSWLYITHDEPRLEDMLAEAAELPATGLVVFKQEPFLLHVRCCSMEAATVLYRLARECGLRESGVAPVGEFPLCALRSTALKMDAIVGSDGNWIVSQDYLALTVDVATQKMRANLAKLGKLERCLRSSLAMHLTPTTASDAAEAAAAGGGAGVIGVVPSKVKAVKTALETRSWIDKNRCIFDCSSADADAVAAAAGSKLMVRVLPQRVV
jgi:tRNA(Phe) wybutosine-synthesizing methylase Tyw3